VNNRGGQPLLATEEALSYWDQRHANRDELRSGGDIGLDFGSNQAFYLRRMGKLLELIEEYVPFVEPCFVLDAGCGKGYFAGQLEECGIRVVGIDASATAINHCLANHAGVYMHSRLDTFESPDLFDCVYAIDVFFHILDDAVWEASFVNLTTLTRPGGALFVTDHNAAGRRQLGDYIVHRPASEYVAIADAHGLEYRGWRPYAFRTNPLGFHCFVRTR
jgi:2-polyprenyl-3-methyl-5-hydroxy-6-metoxy-1,4-benzoquinol methylase